MKKNYLLAIVMIATLVLLTACGGGDSPDTAPPAPAEAAPAADVQPAEEVAPVANTPQPAEEPAPAAETANEFPLPDDAKNITDLGDGAITFQTEQSLPDVLSIYRFAFIGEGYVEREIVTKFTDTMFNAVFDGHASGKAIVVQGVNLGESVQVTLRFD